MSGGGYHQTAPMGGRDGLNTTAGQTQGSGIRSLDAGTGNVSANAGAIKYGSPNTDRTG